MYKHLHATASFIYLQEKKFTSKTVCPLGNHLRFSHLEQDLVVPQTKVKIDKFC